MKDTGFKRLLSAILSLSMILSVAAMPVRAEETPVADDIVIYYDDSASLWGQVFVSWTDPQTNTNEIQEIFDTDADGLYEAQVCGQTSSLSFGPSADISRHLLWLTSVTAGAVYSYTPPIEETPVQEPVEEGPVEGPAEEEPAHEHAYTSAETAPTCTEQGYTTYTCACGDSRTDDYTDALGHDMGDWITDVEASCTEDGSRHKACSRCGYTESETVEAGHSYADGFCDRCGEAEPAARTGEDLIAGGSCGADLTWKLDPNGVLTISGNGPMTSYSSSNAPWYSYCTQITAVTVGNGVTSIGANAFSSCSNLTAVSIGDDVASIETYAFLNCEKLNSITLPGTMNSIGFGAFFNCRSLTEIRIPAGVTTIEDHTFIDCQSLTSVTLPDSLTDIGYGAFSGCYALRDISIPAGVTSIGERAFYQCFSLTSINIPNGVTVIEAYTFSECRSLTGITLPAGVTGIGEQAFYDCRGLKSITIPASVTGIGQEAFSMCNDIGEVLYGGTSDQWSALSNRPEADLVHYSCTGWATVTVPPTCTESGSSREACSCGYERNVSTIPPAGHTEVTDEKVDATCAETGLTEGAHCSVCGTVTLAQEIIPTTDNHQYTNGVCSVCQAVELIASGSYSTDLTWELDALGTLTISGQGDMYGGSSASSYGWYPHRQSVNAIVITDGVTTIGDYAFQGCTGLGSITIPNSVISIGEYAFSGCTALTGITIPEGITSIGNYAFADCSALTGILIPKSVDSIGSYAFSNCSSLTTITIPESVTGLGHYVFNGCSNIEEVFYGGTASQWSALSNRPSATYIHYSCDSGDGHWETASTAPTCTETGSTYETCACGYTRNTVAIGPLGHTEVTDEKVDATCSTTGLTEGAHCSVCGTVTLAQETIPTNDSHSFVDNKCTVCGIAGGRCGDDLTWTLQETVLTVSGTGPMYAYGDMPWYDLRGKITDVYLGSGVTSVSTYAFYGCTNLTTISIPGTVTAIGSYAFSDCDSLTDVYITDVGAWLNIAFEGQGAHPFGVNNEAHTLYLNGAAATGLTVPTGVTAIPDYAFSGCANITGITIPDSVTVIGNEAFYGCSGLTGSVALNGVAAIGDYAFDGCSGLTGATFGEELADIGIWAFANCSGLTAIVIPDSVTAISGGAFYGCSGLRSVTIPDGVTFIDYSAFYGCSSLTAITIPGSVSDIGYAAFCKCSGLTAVTIGDGVTRIGGYAFFDCPELATVIIPETVDTIGSYAFTGCSDMEDVYYGGTSGQWEDLSNRPEADYIHYSCTDSEGHWQSNTALFVETCPCGHERLLGTLQAPTLTVSNVASTGKIRVSWTAVSGATRYTLYIYDESGALQKTSTTTGTAITHNSATAGATYTYKVKALCNNSEATSAFSAAKSRTCDLPRPTVTVRNVASSGKVKISWTAVSGATKYTLYIYDAEGNQLKATTTTGTALIHTSAVVGTTYTYKVKALCGVSAATSAFSEAKSRTCDLPSPVLSVTNVASSGKNKISWNAVSGATKYTLYIYDADGNQLKTSSTTGTSITHNSAVIGTTYTYKVKALCGVSAAASALSEARSRTCDLPRTTVTVSNVASSGKVKISWTAVSGATSYTLYIYDENGNQLKTSTTTGTSITHNTAEAGTTYTYKVKALCGVSAATSAFSEAKSCTCDLARPIVSGTLNSSGKPFLIWGPVSGAVMYTVYTYDANGELLKTASTTGTTLTHSSAAGGTTYSYRVVAVSSISTANSALSTAFSITAG